MCHPVVLMLPYVFATRSVEALLMLNALCAFDSIRRRHTHPWPIDSSTMTNVARELLLKLTDGESYPSTQQQPKRVKERRPNFQAAGVTGAAASNAQLDSATSAGHLEEGYDFFTAVDAACSNQNSGYQCCLTVLCPKLQDAHSVDLISMFQVSFNIYVVSLSKWSLPVSPI